MCRHCRDTALCSATSARVTPRDYGGRVNALGLLTRDWVLHGSLVGWRRATGLPRAVWAELALPVLVDPRDIEALLEALEGAPRVVRVGMLGCYVRVGLEVGPWRGTLAPVVVSPLDSVDWWLPARRFARLPRLPNRPPGTADFLASLWSGGSLPPPWTAPSPAVSRGRR